jgi:hypothetical protein
MSRSARHISVMSFLIVILVAALWPTAPVNANPASFEFTAVTDAACDPGTFPSFLFNYAVGANEYVYHYWTLENNRTGAVSGPSSQGPISGPVSAHGVSFTPTTAVPAGTKAGDTLTERVEVVNMRAEAVVMVAEISYYCGGPGCSVPIPATAVVGTFLGDTPTYYEPGKLVVPSVVIQAGKTAWTLGVDETGAYRKIIWACQYLWVPEGSMGPNYDDVWNGKPLPMDVVE